MHCEEMLVLVGDLHNKVFVKEYSHQEEISYGPDLIPYLKRSIHTKSSEVLFAASFFYLLYDKIL
jgi:hypothetical protein